MTDVANAVALLVVSCVLVLAIVVAWHVMRHGAHVARVRFGFFIERERYDGDDQA